MKPILFVLSVALATACGDETRETTPQPRPPSTPSPPEPQTTVDHQGRNVLWLGHSLIRFAGPLDDEGNPTVIYSVPQVVEQLRAAAETSNHPSAKPADWVRVIASNGWAADGYWSTREPQHEFRTSTLNVIAEPGAPANGRVGNSFEEVALLGRWQPLPGTEPRWDAIIAISGASYFGPDSYERSFRQMSELYRFVREGVDPHNDAAEYRANPETELIHYMGVPAHEGVRAHECQLVQLYRRFDQAFPNSRTAPVAVAFRMAFDAYPRAAQRDRDNFPRVGRHTVDRAFRLENDSVHFADRGLYLAALVFYTMLYGDPAGLPVVEGIEITPAEATLLQRIAKDSLAEYQNYPAECG